MTDDWKQQHANAADAALNHELTQRTITELLDNLGLPADGLPAYGVAKVAHVAAQVARAQALGFDPNLLRLTPDESDSLQLDLAVRAVFAGVPVTMLSSSTDTPTRPQHLGETPNIP